MADGKIRTEGRDGAARKRCRVEARAPSSDATIGHRLVCLGMLLFLDLHAPASAAPAIETRLGLRGEHWERSTAPSFDCVRCVLLARGAEAGMATLGMSVGCDEGTYSWLQDACEGPMLKQESEEEEADAPRRCAVCDGLCDTWYMAQEQAHCSDECARKAQRRRK